MMIDFPAPQMIDTNGVTLEVFTAGEGKPIVLCHGWPEHAFSWRYQVEPLVAAGYHVIIPNQRGYGRSSKPGAVEDYDATHMTADLVGLLDHFGYEDAVFVGHDWGAIMVWNLTLLHPDRVAGVINMSVPYMERGETEWVGFWEKMLGPDFYIVHFNRQPGVADKAFADNSQRFLRNMFRTDQWLEGDQDLGSGMAMVNLAQTDLERPGKLLMSEEDLKVFIDAFASSGYTGGINWYRNFTRNWEILGKVSPRIEQPALMIYGDHDMVPKSANLEQSVPNVEIHTLDCGHWIQQERPAETNQIMADWLAKHYPA
jgi:pimeloyl-ACP methyl ester carboxylesterase